MVNSYLTEYGDPAKPEDQDAFVLSSSVGADGRIRYYAIDRQTGYIYYFTDKTAERVRREGMLFLAVADEMDRRENEVPWFT